MNKKECEIKCGEALLFDKETGKEIMRGEISTVESTIYPDFTDFLNRIKEENTNE